jgi:hypothetical protein
MASQELDQGAETQIYYFGEGGRIMVKAKKMYEYYGNTTYDIEIYRDGERIFSMYGTLDEAREWGRLFAIGLNPPQKIVQEAQAYNNTTVYNWRERDKILKIMVMAGYRCEDIYNDDVVEGNTVHFRYVRYDGPDVFTHHFVCIKPGEKVLVRSRGRGSSDSMGCVPMWDEIIEYRNDNGRIVWKKLSGKVDLECPRPIERAKISDVRDLYPL